MELPFRTVLLAWLAADPLLAAGLNTITEEAPLRASPPWLGIVASASTDFGHKTGMGREVRVALELRPWATMRAELAISSPRSRRGSPHCPRTSPTSALPASPSCAPAPNSAAKPGGRSCSNTARG